MASCERLTFAALGELVEGIGARDLWQPVARIGVARIRRNQRLRDELCHLVEDLDFGMGGIGSDCTGGLPTKIARRRKTRCSAWVSRP